MSEPCSVPTQGVGTQVLTRYPGVHNVCASLWDGWGNARMGRVAGVLLPIRFRQPSAQAIAAALPCSGVKTLNFNCNQIGDRGAQALAAALAGSGVTGLHFDGNQIGDRGAQALAAALPSSGVKTLGLWGNQISDGAQSALREAAPDVNMYF